MRRGHWYNFEVEVQGDLDVSTSEEGEPGVHTLWPNCMLHPRTQRKGFNARHGMDLAEFLADPTPVRIYRHLLRMFLRLPGDDGRTGSELTDFINKCALHQHSFVVFVVLIDSPAFFPAYGRCNGATQLSGLFKADKMLAASQQ